MECIKKIEKVWIRKMNVGLCDEAFQRSIQAANTNIQQQRGSQQVTSIHNLQWSDSEKPAMNTKGIELLSKVKRYYNFLRVMRWLFILVTGFVLMLITKINLPEQKAIWGQLKFLWDESTSTEVFEALTLEILFKKLRTIMRSTRKLNEHGCFKDRHHSESMKSRAKMKQLGERYSYQRVIYTALRVDKGIMHPFENIDRLDTGLIWQRIKARYNHTYNVDCTMEQMYWIADNSLRGLSPDQSFEQTHAPSTLYWQCDNVLYQVDWGVGALLGTSAERELTYFRV
jgi:hypothetical protein